MVFRFCIVHGRCRLLVMQVWWGWLVSWPRKISIVAVVDMKWSISSNFRYSSLHVATSSSDKGRKAWANGETIPHTNERRSSVGTSRCGLYVRCSELWQVQATKSTIGELPFFGLGRHRLAHPVAWRIRPRTLRGVLRLRILRRVHQRLVPRWWKGCRVPTLLSGIVDSRLESICRKMRLTRATFRVTPWKRMN